MINMDVETKVLLDKLYNLRNKDSIILSKMDDEKDIAEQTKDRTAAEKLDLAAKVKVLSDEEILLAKEGKLLKEALKNINKASFGVVFNKLNIDFDPKKLSEEVESVLPSTIEEIKKSILNTNENLDNVIKDMNDAITKIDELVIRKDEAIGNQTKLNEYFELALAGNINITRDALTNLLSKFELSTEEQRESAKLLMFPEDGLYEYDTNANKKTGKSFSDVFAEAKQGEEINPIKLEEIKPIQLNSQVTPIKLSELKEEVKEIVVDEKIMIPSEKKENVNVKELLKEKGFNVEEISVNDISYLEEKFSSETFEKNIKVVNDLGLNSDIFIENIELFIDVDLEEKLNILINVGKVPFDIYLNPNILVKYDAVELKKSIDSLIASGLEPKKVPLMAF